MNNGGEIKNENSIKTAIRLHFRIILVPVFFFVTKINYGAYSCSYICNNYSTDGLDGYIARTRANNEIRQLMTISR